jgi:hypothetical protein
MKLDTAFRKHVILSKAKGLCIVKFSQPEKAKLITRLYNPKNSFKMIKWKALLHFLVLSLAQTPVPGLNTSSKPPRCSFLENHQSLRFFVETFPEQLRMGAYKMENSLRAKDHYVRTMATCGWIPQNLLPSPLRPDCSQPPQKLICECEDCASGIPENTTLARLSDTQKPPYDHDPTNSLWHAEFLQTIMYCVAYALFWGHIYHLLLVKGPLLFLNKVKEDIYLIFPSVKAFPLFLGYVLRHWLKRILCQKPGQRHSWTEIRNFPFLARGACSCCKSLRFQCAEKSGYLPQGVPASPLTSLVDSQFSILENLRKRTTEDSLLYSSMSESAKTLHLLLLELQRATERLNQHSHPNHSYGTLPRSQRFSNTYQTIPGSGSQLSPDSAVSMGESTDLLGTQSVLDRFQRLEMSRERDTLQLDRLIGKIHQLREQLGGKADKAEKTARQIGAAVLRCQENIDNVIRQHSCQIKFSHVQFRRQQNLLQQAVAIDEELYLEQLSSTGCCVSGLGGAGSPYQTILQDLASPVNYPGILSEVPHVPLNLTIPQTTSAPENQSNANANHEGKQVLIHMYLSICKI